MTEEMEVRGAGGEERADEGRAICILATGYCLLPSDLRVLCENLCVLGGFKPARGVARCVTETEGKRCEVRAICLLHTAYCQLPTIPAARTRNAATTSAFNSIGFEPAPALLESFSPEGDNRSG